MLKFIAGILLSTTVFVSAGFWGVSTSRLFLDIPIVGFSNLDQVVKAKSIERIREPNPEVVDQKAEFLVTDPTPDELPTLSETHNFLDNAFKKTNNRYYRDTDCSATIYYHWYYSAGKLNRRTYEFRYDNMSIARPGDFYKGDEAGVMLVGDLIERQYEEIDIEDVNSYRSLSRQSYEPGRKTSVEIPIGPNANRVVNAMNYLIQQCGGDELPF
jgi:hypothetical protein